MVAPPDGQWQMISTAKELAALSEKGGTGYYKLANDITEYVGYYSFSSKDPAFNGVLDGDGHTVTFADADKNPNPVINTLGSDGVIQNLGVKGSISNPALVNKLDGKLSTAILGQNPIMAVLWVRCAPAPSSPTAM